MAEGIDRHIMEALAVQGMPDALVHRSIDGSVNVVLQQGGVIDTDALREHLVDRARKETKKLHEEMDVPVREEPTGGRKIRIRKKLQPIAK